MMRDWGLEAGGWGAQRVSGVLVPDQQGLADGSTSNRKSGLCRQSPAPSPQPHALHQR